MKMKKIVSFLLCLCLVLAGCVGCRWSKGGDLPHDSSNIKTRSGAVYEIYVASFNDSDGDQVGDLNGIKEKLEYLHTLGVEYIWLMPIHPSHSYHKYDVDDYMAIDPAYGTMDDFRGLIKAAEAYGIKIIMDMVINHTSSHHPWFQQALAEAMKGKMDGKAEFYNFSNKPIRKSTKVKDGLYYESAFVSEMPDLNLGNPQVKAELEKIAAFYLKMGVAGFRLDAALHYFGTDNKANIAFLKWYGDMCRKYRPDVYLTAEVWSDSATVESYYASGVDSFFNFALSEGKGLFARAINAGRGADLAKYLADYDASIHKLNPQALNAVYLSNHDQGRSAGFLPELTKNKLAEAMYIWLPGRPYLYYGEEVRLKGSGKDENKRTYMPWNASTKVKNPVGTDYDQAKQVTETVEAAVANPDSLLNYIEELLAVRNSYPWLERGVPTAVPADERLLVLEVNGRNGEGRAVIVHNLSADMVEFSPSGEHLRPAKLMNKADKFNHGCLQLAPYSSAFLVEVSGEGKK